MSDATRYRVPQGNAMDERQYWSHPDSQIMAMAAVDYCIRRGTAITETCRRWLRTHWDSMTPSTQAYIIKELLLSVHEGVAGHPKIDAPKWKDVALELYARSREEVQSDVRAKLRAWPEFGLPG